MDVSKLAKIYAQTLVLFLLLDATWIGVIGAGFYKAQIGVLMAANPNWLAAALFYVLYIAGLQLFVILPALKQRSTALGAFLGGAFGLLTYATYDLTNLATLDRWPVLVTVVDLLWGTFLCTAVCAAIVNWHSRPAAR